MYGMQTILEELSFTIESGKLVAIIGPNGAGKSTLLRLLMGFEEPTRGDIILFNQSPKEARTGIGYVPQRFQFDRSIPMTVLEFLLRSAEVNGVPTVRRDAMIAQRMEQVGMQTLGSRQLGQLSGGEMQRMMIARALLTEKQLLLFDEPTTGVDIEGQDTIYELIQRIHAETQSTCIIISHELDVVFRYAEQVLCLNKRLLCQGIPSETLTKHRLEEMYGEGHAAHYHHHCMH